MTYFNSNSSRAAGVGIAIKLTSDIQVLDSERDTEDRILILKTMIENELITLVSFYDTNENKENTQLQPRSPPTTKAKHRQL